jgi:hypothetical protein
VRQEELTSLILPNRTRKGDVRVREPFSKRHLRQKLRALHPHIFFLGRSELRSKVKKISDDSFDTIAYLKGRKAYLNAQTVIWPSGTSKHACAQARLYEVAELLYILEAFETRAERRRTKNVKGI